MANAEHVKMLVNSTKDEWNAWRASDRDLQPDLSNLGIAEAILGSAQPDERDLIDLSGIDFRQSNLQGADFTKLNIDCADLRFADLTGATFRVTSADNAKFIGAVMHKAKVFSAGDSADNSGDTNGPVPAQTIVFARPGVTELELRGASLRGANFTYANLSGADLGAADLTDAILRVSNLKDTNLSNAALIRTDLESTTIWHSKLLPLVAERSLSDLFLIDDRIEDIGTLMSTVEGLGLDRQGVDLLAGRSVYFRGEKDHRYDLAPSAMRNQGLENSEDVMLTELSIKRPEDIDGRQLYFQRLMLARHFELPTRLLDVTRNPLVALYYASENASDGADGVVHVFVVDNEAIKPFDSDTVSLISNFVRLKNWEKSILLSYNSWKPSPSGSQHMVQAFEGAYEAALTRLNHFVAQEKPYWEPRIDLRDLFRVFVVEPQQQFDRLRSHSGAFMLSAFHRRFERVEVDKWFKCSGRYEYRRLVVPHASKRRIRNHLRLSDISEERLKADLQSAAESIARSHRSSG